MKKWGLLVCGLVFLLGGRPALAASEFSTEYETTYQVMENGQTKVSMKIELKNKLSNIYADKFSLSIGNTDLNGIKVKDGLGEIEPKITQTANQTTVSFSFNNRVVGKDKVNTFFISYESSDVASKNGAIWEINIPPLDSDKDVMQNSVILVVPEAMGEPAFISPPAEKSYRGVIDKKGVRSYIFGTQTLGSKAVSAVFGKTQYLAFDLKYALANINPVKSKQTIALPPDTNYQKIFIQKIEPKPLTVERDSDGNWLATYELNPQQNINVRVEGLSRIDFEAGKEDLEPDMARYLKPTEVWQSDALALRNLASELKTAAAIYDYVVDHLSYDYSKVVNGGKREGALKVFENPLSAICTEFTDLFIALARAAGIPAREVVGFAFTNNDKLRPLSLTQDVLHSWPEYYDLSRKRWIQIDPTWGRTTGGVDYFGKFDLNHFAFVIHGSDPNMPPPAGAYKLGGSKKDVLVSAVGEVEFPRSKLKASLLEKKSGEIRLELSNEEGVSFNSSVSVKATTEGIINYQERVYLPAFGKKEITIALKNKLDKQTKLILDYESGRTELTIDQGSESQAIRLAKGLGIIIAAGGAIGAVRLLLRRRTKKSFIYW